MANDDAIELHFNCKYCGNSITEKPEHSIVNKIVSVGGDLAHEDCAMDHQVIISRENHICD